MTDLLTDQEPETRFDRAVPASQLGQVRPEVVAQLDQARRQNARWLLLAGAAAYGLTIPLNILAGDIERILILLPVPMLLLSLSFAYKEGVTSMSQSSLDRVALAVFFLVAVITIWPNGGLTDIRSYCMALIFIAISAAVLGLSNLWVYVVALVALLGFTLILEVSGITYVAVDSEFVAVQTRAVTLFTVIMYALCLYSLVRTQRKARKLLAETASAAESTQRFQSQFASTVSDSLRGPTMQLFHELGDIRSERIEVFSQLVLGAIKAKSRVSALIASRLAIEASRGVAMKPLDIVHYFEDYAGLWHAIARMNGIRASAVAMGPMPEKLWLAVDVLDLTLDYWITEVIWRWRDGSLELRYEIVDEHLVVHIAYEHDGKDLRRIRGMLDEPTENTIIPKIRMSQVTSSAEQPIYIRRLVDAAEGELVLDMPEETHLNVSLCLPMRDTDPAAGE